MLEIPSKAKRENIEKKKKEGENQTNLTGNRLC